MSDLETDNPFVLFDSWFSDASTSEGSDPNAMAVATADLRGRPSVRILLLKNFDERGFVFYTNFESRKGIELSANPYASLCFHWKTLKRQVRIEGPINIVSNKEADAYFESRARISQLGALASKQSRPLDCKKSLIDLVEKLKIKYANQGIPRPPYWTGARVSPLRMEFWLDAEFRLHDRFVFVRESEKECWNLTRLKP